MNEPDYTIKRIADMERAFRGMLVRARAELGVTSFGMQVIDLPPDSGDVYPEHDHAHTSQEEVYLLLEGEADMILPDKTFALKRDLFVRVGAATRRRVRSGPAGARMIVIGGTPGQPYVPQPNSELGAPEVIHANASTSMRD